MKLSTPYFADYDATSTQGVAQEILAAQNPPVFLDTETTGFTDDCEVIEVALVQEAMEHTRMFYPTAPMTLGAIKVHGYTLLGQPLCNAKVFSADHHCDITDTIDGAIVCAYNSPFDERLLNQTCARYGLPEFDFEWLDVMELATRHWGPMHGVFEKGRLRALSLAECCEIIGIKQKDAHHALDDARNTKLVLEAIAAGK
jgi:DNA polymerase III epsilon subunit-like protein